MGHEEGDFSRMSGTDLRGVEGADEGRVGHVHTEVGVEALKQRGVAVNVAAIERAAACERALTS
eukprot:SAG11_NODE_18446_length_491_cov_0.658163_1_plen_64_part_00